MDVNNKSWGDYYKAAQNRPHQPLTELAIKHNSSNCQVAIECGCGTGCDVKYLSDMGYRVHAFDSHPDSVNICQHRFAGNDLVNVSQNSFEQFDYPKTGLVLANSSLFYADPAVFTETWTKIVNAIEIGGVFAGDFMGTEDEWAAMPEQTTNPLTRQQVEALFDRFEIVQFNERNEIGRAVIGTTKHWHTFTVLAVKCN